MSSGHLYTLTRTNTDLVILAALATLIILLGGTGVYLVEHERESANITSLGDAFWWAVVTVATVGYGDYYPVTTVGRLIAIFMMLSGIGVFLLLVSTLAQRRLGRTESKLGSKTNPQDSILLDYETKAAIKTKIDVIEKLSEEDFDELSVKLKKLRRALLQESKVSKCSECGASYRDKVRFCSNCGRRITS